MQRENQRVRITKILLNESFLNLLKEKPLSRVTVKDICEAAELNRSTYYHYFTDPYDQMSKLEIAIIEEMSSCINISKEDVLTGHGKLYPVIKKMLDYMQEKKNMFRILLSNHGDISLQKDIMTVFAEKVLNPTFNETEEYAELLQEFIFVGNGSFGLIYYWLMAGSNESTEQLARYITTFVEDFLHMRANKR